MSPGRSGSKSVIKWGRLDSSVLGGLLTKVRPSENKNCRGSLYTCFPSMGFWPLALSMHPPALRASEIPASNSFNVIQELLHQHPQEWAAPSSLHEGHKGRMVGRGVSRTPSTHTLN